jgi:hypothetical protein
VPAACQSPFVRSCHHRHLPGCTTQEKPNAATPRRPSTVYAPDRDEATDVLLAEAETLAAL